MQLTDQIGREVFLKNNPPKRIVSLVPSLSQLICDLDCEENLVAVTRFCTHPKHLRKQKTIVGGTKDPDLDLILSLKPDLIIANKEENRQEDIVKLEKQVAVYVSEVNSLQANYAMIEDLGKMLNKNKQANNLIESTQKAFQSLRQLPNIRTAYFIWNNPIMVAGSNNIISSILGEIGVQNIFANYRERYPIVDITTLKKENPELIILSSEPYPFKEKNKLEMEQHFPNSKVLLADGVFFSWYGSSLQKTAAYVEALFHS
jgi:ABC-type Fe3+-hydroxamate transport system substrate-binding protein